MGFDSAFVKESKNDKNNREYIATYCSDSKVFYRLLKDELLYKSIEDEYYLVKLTLKDVNSILNTMIDRVISNYPIKEFSINYSFIEEDTDEIRLQPCDGVEISSFEGYDRIYTNSEEGERLNIALFDQYEYYIMLNIIRTLIKCLDFDFDNYDLYFEASW